MNLKEVAEVAWLQLFPGGADEPTVDREDFVSTAKSEFAFQLWRKIKEDKFLYGESDIPSYLLTETELDVVNDEIDLKDLHIMRSIDQELWLQDVGGMNCECMYIKSTVNNWKALCDDDSLPDDAKVFYPLGLKVKFPLGTHANKIAITFAKSGEDIEDNIEVDDAIAGIVRRELINIYGNKLGVEDEKNDSNSNSK